MRAELSQREVRLLGSKRAWLTKGLENKVTVEPGVTEVMMSCGDGGTLVWGLSGAVFTTAGTREGSGKESGNQDSHLPGYQSGHQWQEGG